MSEEAVTSIILAMWARALHHLCLSLTVPNLLPNEDELTI